MFSWSFHHFSTFFPCFPGVFIIFPHFSHVSNTAPLLGPNQHRAPSEAHAQGRWDGLAQRRAGLPAPGTLRAASGTPADAVVGFEDRLMDVNGLIIGLMVL